MMINMIRLRLIQIYKNKAILILAMLITLIFAALVTSIYSQVQQAQVLNVGVIDLDQTDFSKHVMENVANHGMFNQQVVDYDGGIAMLKSHDIELMYLITEGASANVDEAEYEGLIQLYFIGDNYLSPLLGDVLVGEMFQEISMQASLNLLETAVAYDYDFDLVKMDALAYSESLKATIEKDKYVDVVFEDLENDRIVAEEMINTNLLYKQMLLGVILAFLGIYILFCATSINRDYEVKMISKINISKATTMTIVMGHYLSIVIGVLPIVIVFSIINGVFDQGVKGFVSYMLIYLLYAMVASGLTLLLAMIMPSVSSYIVIGSAIVLILGIISGSFFNIDLTVASIKQMASLTYSYHALNQLMDIITLQNLPNLTSYFLFMVTNLLCLLLLCFIVNRFKVRSSH